MSNLLAYAAVDTSLGLYGSNLIAYFPLEEKGGLGRDFTTGGFLLTDKNTVTNAAGNISTRARLFTAANQEALYYQGNLGIGDAGLSVSAWIYPTATADQYVVSVDDTAEADRGWWIFWAQSSEWVAGVSGTGADAFQPSPITGTINAWNHVVLVYDKDTSAVYVYLNGALAGTSAGPAAWNHTSSAPLNIGARDAAGSGGGGWFSGRVGHVGIWSGALSATAVGYLYASGSGLALYGGE